MSTSVFPTLPGLGWDIVRTQMWDTIVQKNISGKQVRNPNMAYPLYEYQLTFDVLRQGTVNGTAYTELATLFGFFNQRQGQFDSFLYNDTDDNTSSTDQGIGTGDGVTTAFQLVRSFGGYAEPILAPNVITNVKVNGSVMTPTTDYTVSTWGSAAPGVVTFTSAPANAATITATFTFYWPCHFTVDKMSYNKFVNSLWAGKRLTFESVKN